MTNVYEFAKPTLPTHRRPSKVQLTLDMNTQANPIHGGPTAWERSEPPTPSTPVDVKPIRETVGYAEDQAAQDELKIHRSGTQGLEFSSSVQAAKPHQEKTVGPCRICC